MMTAEISEVATILPQKKHSRQEIPFTEFEPLLNQLRTSANTTQTDAAKLIGYEGSAISGWKSTGLVPMVAFNSLKWVLHERKVNPKTFGPRIRLSTEESAQLLGILTELPTDPATKRNLIKKLAAMIAEE